MNAPLRFLPVNLDALLVELPDLQSTLALLASLQAEPLDGVLELVPAARTLLVRFGPGRTDAPTVARAIAARPTGGPLARSDRRIEIPVHYDGEDLAEVAGLLGMSPEEVVRRHTGSDYTVAFTGFAPGFAYLSGGDAAFDLPRRSVPRTRIPAGAVGLAGRFSGVYPQASPGGWQIIGRTSTPMWDLSRPRPALLQPGDRVRFVDAGAATPTPSLSKDPQRSPPLPHAPTDEPHLEVIQPGLQALWQDAGRHGQAGQGVSASGAMDRASLQHANRLVGNDSGEACVEIACGGFEFACHADAVIAVTGADTPLQLLTADGQSRDLPCHQAHALVRGDRLRLGEPRAGMRNYLAARGGFDLPAVLGSRSTDTLAQVGPPPLRAGDRLVLRPVARGAIVAAAEPPPTDLPTARDEVVLDVVAGPRTDWFTPEAVRLLCSQSWQVTPQSNRVGIRLQGEQSLARAVAGELPSEGTLRGSIQVPPSGQPVLFLADHPLTGGYPVIGSVALHHLDRAGQIPIGARVRFQLVAGFAPIDA